MDGGGRVLEPLTAGPPGLAASRPPHVLAGRRAVGPGLRLSSLLIAPFAAFGLRRRRASVAVPLARRMPRLAGTWLVLAFFGAVGAYGSVQGGQYAALRAAYGEPGDMVARLLGFGLDRITISGLSQLSQREILKIGGVDGRTSLPFLDVAEVRARLEATPLVMSASVRKLYPHELAITLVERAPYALWQMNGELNVVAQDGTTIDAMRDRRFASLPLVVAEGANARAASYLALLDAAGPLRPRIRAGMLVSGRRWTLKIDNGLDVKLPEEGASAAMERLVRLDREQHILDKDVLAVDLRIPDRVVVRLGEEAASVRAESQKKKPQRGTKGIET